MTYRTVQFTVTAEASALLDADNRPVNQKEKVSIDDLDSNVYRLAGIVKGATYTLTNSSYQDLTPITLSAAGSNRIYADYAYDEENPQTLTYKVPNVPASARSRRATP